MFYHKLYRLVLFSCLTIGVLNPLFAEEDTNYKSGRNYESRNQYEQALRYYLDAILVYTTTDDQEGLFTVNKTIGFMCSKWGALEKAVDYLEKALIIHSNEPTGKVLDILSELAKIYETINKERAAIEKLDKLTQYYIDNKMNVMLIENLLKKSALYNLIRDYDKARSILNKALKFSEIEENVVFKLEVLNDLGFAHVKADNNYAAEEPLKKALSISDQYKNQQNIKALRVSILSNLAIFNQVSGNYATGIDYVNKALRIAEEETLQYEYIDIANIATKMNIVIYDLVQAKNLNDVCVGNAERLNYSKGLETAYALRHELYEKQGESKLALIAFQEYNKLKANLEIEQRKAEAKRATINATVTRIEQDKTLEHETERVKETEERLEEQKKEKQNAELERQRALAAANAAQARAEQEAAKVSAEQAKVKAQQAKVKEQEALIIAEQAKADAAEQAKKASAAEAIRRTEELRNIQREKEIAEKNRAREIEVQKNRQIYFYAGMGLLVLILILILGFLYTKQRDNKKLAKSNEQLEKQRNEIRNQNDALHNRELALEENAVKLQSMNDELQVTLDDLQNTQSQLIEAERMASLGQLIAGVAHEVNTPLGAINASITNISDSLKHSTEMMPDLYRSFDEDSAKLFSELINSIFMSNIVMTSREERALRRKLSKSLSRIPNFKGHERDIAASFVDMGLKIDDTDAFVKKFEPLFLNENSKFIVECAYHIAIQNKSSSNINVAVQKASKVVFALKNYSRQSDFNTLTEASIVESVETVLTVYHNTIKHGIDLHKEYGENIPYTYCYADELSQVWTNILMNAIHAVNNQGRIDIDVHQKEQYIVVNIKDYGTGIPQAIVKKIFNPFFTTKKAGEGTGLGLDIVKKIIDKHNGHITVESEEGVGTCFTISIPILSAEEAKMREKQTKTEVAA